MEKAGVSPWFPDITGTIRTRAFFAEAKPPKSAILLLIKARAGGGGKGMRLVEKPKGLCRCSRLRQGAQREGEASFGNDPRVLVEKFVTSPRHIEVQVFGDTHGNVAHLL